MVPYSIWVSSWGRILSDRREQGEVDVDYANTPRPIGLLSITPDAHLPCEGSTLVGSSDGMRLSTRKGVSFNLLSDVFEVA